MNQTPAGFGPPPEPFEPRSSGTGAGTGGRSGRRTAVVLAVLVGVLLALGGGTYLALGGGRGGDGKEGKDSATPTASASVDQGDGKGPGVGPHTYDPNAGIQPGEAKVWLRDNETELAGSGAAQFGPWRVGDVVVRAMHKEIAGYAVTDGQEKWKLSFQTPLCGFPREPSPTGKLVVGVKETDSTTSHCNQLQLVDLAAGTTGWKVPIPQESRYDTALELEMAMTGDTVAVARPAFMSGFSVTDGRKLFGTSHTNGCSPRAFAGGSRLIALRNCFPPKEPTASAQSMIEEMDPATGGSKWSHTYDKGWNVGRVLSVDPLVVAAYNKEKKTWNITAFAADGKIRSQSDAAFGVSGRCNGWGNATGYQECYAAVADADTLYIGAGKPDKELGIEDTLKVVAVDLNTGKEKWSTPEQPKGRTMWPLAVEAGRVVVYVAPGAGAAASVISLSAADGSSQPLLQSPAAAAGAQGVFYDHGVRIAWAGGRLFLLNGRVKGPEPGAVSRSILSFGK